MPEWHFHDVSNFDIRRSVYNLRPRIFWGCVKQRNFYGRWLYTMPCREDFKFWRRRLGGMFNLRCWIHPCSSHGGVFHLPWWYIFDRSQHYLFPLFTWHLLFVRRIGLRSLPNRHLWQRSRPVHFGMLRGLRQRVSLPTGHSLPPRRFFRALGGGPLASYHAISQRDNLVVSFRRALSLLLALADAIA